MATIGLVLEGGGMRGLFTAGVLDAFLDEEIVFDKIIGVSAGACHACSYVSKQKERAKNTNLNYLQDYRYASLRNWITRGDYFNPKFLYDTIPNKLDLFDHDTFNQSKTKLFAVITDVETSKPIYYPLQDMEKDIQGLRASASLPLLSRKVLLNGRYYLDGGISDSVPLKKIQEECDKVIVVLTRERGYRKKGKELNGIMKIVYRKYPNLVSKMEMRSSEYNQTMDYLDEQERQGKVLVVAPFKKIEIGRLEKNKEKLENLYYHGVEIVQKQKNKIKEFLK